MRRAPALAVPATAAIALALLAACASDPASAPAPAAAPPVARAPASTPTPAPAPAPKAEAAPIPPPKAAAAPIPAPAPKAAASAPAYSPNKLVGDANRGKDYFNVRCIKCHVKEGMGAPYVGIVGRKAGTVPGFDYSPALKASGITWNEEMLERWLTDPDQVVPGNLMGLKIRNPQLRADIVAYLKIRV